jgi:hypothetical protein
MSTQTLTAEDSKLVLAILKQLDLSQFTVDYLQLAEDLGLSGGAGKGKSAASMRWVRFKKKMAKAVTGEDGDGKTEEDNPAGETGEGKSKGTPKGKKTGGGGGGKKRKVTGETHGDEEEEQQAGGGGGGKRRKVAGMKNEIDGEMKSETDGDMKNETDMEIKGENNLAEVWDELAGEEYYDSVY